MKAVLQIAKNSVEFRDLPEPRLKDPGDVLLRLEAASICQSDSKLLNGMVPTKKLPIAIGHEASGVVVEAGKDVKKVVPGDRVLIDPNVYDLTCNACTSGFSNLCLNGGLMGRDVDGVLQEFLTLPSKRVYRLPRDVPADVAPLLQPFSTVIHAHRQIEINPGNVVVVLGLGVVGLMLAKLANLRGAKVMGVDIVPAKLELARKLGIDVVVNSLDVDLPAEVTAITEGRGADVVIEAAGVPDLIKDGIQLLKPRGVLLQFGSSPKQAFYNMRDLYFKELVLKGTRSSLPEDFDDAIRIVQRGQIDFSYWISRIFRFEETKEAISYFQDRANVLKVVIKS